MNNNLQEEEGSYPYSSNYHGDHGSHDDNDASLSSSDVNDDSLVSIGTSTSGTETSIFTSMDELEQWARLFEQHGGIEIKDRKWHLRTYKHCFIGSEAVDYMMAMAMTSSFQQQQQQVTANTVGTSPPPTTTTIRPSQTSSSSWMAPPLRIPNSRAHAVQIGQELQRKLNLFEHVCRAHDFQDDYLFYRFVPNQHRFVSLDNLFDVLRLETNNDNDDDDDDYSLSSSVSNTSSSIRSNSTSPSRVWGLDDVEQVFVDCVEIKNRRFHLTTYGNCFVGNQAVSGLVSSGVCRTRSEAVCWGKRLQSERRLFRHVTNEHDFKDDYLFYRLVPPNERRRMHKGLSGDSNTDGEGEEESVSVHDIALQFYNGIKVRDMMYRLKTYKKVFVGSRAVDWLIRHQFAQSRQEAVELGRDMGSNLGVFGHVTNDHPFQDDYLFYRFVPPSKWKSPSTTEHEQRHQKDDDDDGQDNGTDDQQQLQELADVFRRGVKVQNNRHLGKIHRRTFVGSQAVDFMVNSSMASTRREAVEIGRRLASDFKLFDHVYGEHDFSDDLLFYRFTDDARASRRGGLLLSNMSDLSDLSLSSVSSTSSLSLEKIAEVFRKGVVVKDRRYHFRTYKKCFVGSEAIDFLVGSTLACSRMEAVDIGRSLAREFQLFEHVTRDHEFKDDYLFYRLLDTSDANTDEEDLSIDSSRLFQMAQLFEAGIEVKEHRHRMRVYRDTFVGSEAVDFMLKSKMASSRIEAVRIGRAFAKEFNLIEHVTRSHLFSDEHFFFRFLSKGQRHSWFREESMHSVALPELVVHSDDLEWAQRVKEFETRMLIKRQRPKSSSFGPATQGDMEQVSTAIRTRNWAKELRRLDPRYQILNFFTDLALEGAHNIEEAELDAVPTRPLLHYFPRSSVFTIWRPTSFEAIRRMMLGEAVGKGLDIKGKSAKRGKLKSYVPFLQISQNKHKRQIRTLLKHGTVRLFFKSDARRARDIAAEKLEEVAEEMMKIVEEAKRVLANDKADERSRKDAMDSMLLDMSNPSIAYVDAYAPLCYGLDIPVRLLWEAYYVRQDCTRKPGSEYDMGRPSQPAFQDMNFASLRGKTKDGFPRTVLIQNADPDSPMNPFEILMAYEEDGQVLPVVSDFDCFLVGSRGIRYSSPLPPCQLRTLQQCLTRIEAVLDGSTPELRNTSWTNRWLDVLKSETAESGRCPKTPMYGFGDPKSYSIMKNAVTRLKMIGAVRHGAESFNYEFPQELDEEYLIVYDNLPGGLSWKYVDMAGLHSFLHQKVDEGYTLPLNVKWILCDENWKVLYDRLMASENKNVIDSLNTWFPPGTGIREKIEDIHKRHPDGFAGTRIGTSRSLRQSGVMALASLALQENSLESATEEIEQFA